MKVIYPLEITLSVDGQTLPSTLTLHTAPEQWSAQTLDLVGDTMADLLRLAIRAAADGADVTCGTDRAFVVTVLGEGTYAMLAEVVWHGRGRCRAITGPLQLSAEAVARLERHRRV